MNIRAVIFISIIEIPEIGDFETCPRWLGLRKFFTSVDCLGCTNFLKALFVVT